MRVVFSSVRLVPARGGWRVACRDRDGREWAHHRVVEDYPTAERLARRVAVEGEADEERWIQCFGR